MKRATEIFINILFWLSTVWALGQIFTFQTLEVDAVIINGVKEVIETPKNGMQWLVHYGIPLRVLLFYFLAFKLVPDNFHQKRYLKFSLWSLLLFASVYIVELVLLGVLEGQINWALSSSFLGIYIFYFSVSFAYGMLRNLTRIESQKQLLKNEKLNAELKLLRSQINPHFLFNSLNNLLAIAEREQNQEISNGITQLSDLLRFLIYDTQTDTVKLEKEVEFINAYIALHRLRYTQHDQVKIHFEASGIEPNHTITPSLLIPFVENAFKHGVHLKAQSFIRINVQVIDDQLIFNVTNSKHYIQKTEFDQTYSGIGLDNVKRRLALLDPDIYSFNIKDNEGTFSVNLKIDLRD